MPAPYAELADLQRWRPGGVDPEEIDSAGMLLEEASARLRVRVPSIDSRLEAGTLDPVIPRGIACRMVADVLNNPERYSSEQAGDATYRFDLEVVRRQMVPTDDELADLGVTATKRSSVGTGRMRIAL